MIGGSVLKSMRLKYFGRLGRCKRCTFEPTLPAQPARHALWVGSSYWGTRNRHPPTGHTPLDTVDKFNDPDIGRCAFNLLGIRWSVALAKSHDPDQSRSSFGLPGIGHSNSACPSAIFARQPRGVTVDFWYPSMRRATPAAVAQRRPTEASKLRQRQWSQPFENGVTPGWWNP
jgi:hypothetical protein